MNKIEDYIAKLKKADKAYINEQILRVIQEESNAAIDLNHSQLYSGIDSQGQPLKKYRNPKYAIFKNTLNSIPGLGTPDLKLSGRFYDAFYLQFNSGNGWPISFWSRDNKTQELTQKYGKDIFGLTPENKENFRDQIKPKIQKIFANIFSV